MSTSFKASLARCRSSGGPTASAARRACTRPTACSTCPGKSTLTACRRLAALEAPRGSFEDARDAIRAHTGVEIAKRQVEDLAGRAAVDFEAFYERRERPVSDLEEWISRGASGKLRKDCHRELSDCQCDCK